MFELRRAPRRGARGGRMISRRKFAGLVGAAALLPAGLLARPERLAQGDEGYRLVVGWLSESRTIEGVEHLHIGLNRFGDAGRVLFTRTTEHRGIHTLLKELSNISPDRFISAQRALLSLARRREWDPSHAVYDKIYDQQIVVPLGNGENFTGRLSMGTWGRAHGSVCYNSRIHVDKAQVQGAVA